MGDEADALAMWDDWTQMAHGPTYDGTTRAKNPRKVAKKDTARGTNKFPGICVGCNQNVPAGAGTLFRLQNCWRVRCKRCEK